MIGDADQAYLKKHFADHRVVSEGNQELVLLPAFELPEGFQPTTVEMLLVLPFGFPETQPDMFWVYPWVTLYGGMPQNADQRGSYLGRDDWQRFSRHLPQNVWRPGVDSLQTWMATIRRQLCAEAAAAMPKAA